jgi:class 3 adenylate cyclase
MGMTGPSGTVTFLFTDIEGSTRLWEQDEVAMRAAISRHDEMLRKAVADHGGVVFATMGDGIAAAFGSASAAVFAAVTAQGLLAAETWQTQTPIRVRMGIHTGAAELCDGDYLGPPVNRAARLMAIGHGGQVLCSSATAELVGDGVGLVDLGRQRLRDLDRPMHVFQVCAHGLTAEFPRLRSLEAFPGNLPVQFSSLVGRDTDLVRVKEALGSSRLVTLTGVGGVGKTRLSVQVAAEVLPAYRDGVWLCELAAADDPASVHQVVAAALGVAVRPGIDLRARVADFLAAKDLLVVLDNCEHVLDAAADLVGVLLRGCPGVRVLATSREALALGGEHTVPLRSLSLPETSADVEKMAASDAVLLFVERAATARGGFALTAGNAAAVGEVCRRLDGIPLALELAAARVATMGPAEIAGHLDERFRLLAGRRRGGLERHLVSPECAAVLAGIFEVRFIRQSARFVLVDHDTKVAQVREQLGADAYHTAFQKGAAMTDAAAAGYLLDQIDRLANETPSRPTDQ